MEARVRAGGHDVPPETVRRRYFLGIRNLIHLYSSKATTWGVYNNDEPDGPRLIAREGGLAETEVSRAKDWQRIFELADATTAL